MQLVNKKKEWQMTYVLYFLSLFTSMLPSLPFSLLAISFPHLRLSVHRAAAPSVTGILEVDAIMVLPPPHPHTDARSLTQTAYKVRVSGLRFQSWSNFFLGLNYLVIQVKFCDLHLLEHFFLMWITYYLVTPVRLNLQIGPQKNCNLDGNQVVSWNVVSFFRAGMN